MLADRRDRRARRRHRRRRRTVAGCERPSRRPRSTGSRAARSAATRCSTSTRPATSSCSSRPKGAIDEGRGDCNFDSSVAWSGDELPDATVTITGPDGDEVEIAPDDGVDYDAGGSQGSSIGTVTIEQDGDHLLRVASLTTMASMSASAANPNDRRGTHARRGTGIVGGRPRRGRAVDRDGASPG